MPMNKPWTQAEAVEAGRRGGLASGETRRRQATMSPEERAQDAIRSRLGRLTAELLAAALGEGDFEELKPETRLTAILRSMEWGLGKAATAPRPEPGKEETPALTGDDLFEPQAPGPRAPVGEEPPALGPSGEQEEE